jgi:hypothetical protein
MMNTLNPVLSGRRMVDQNYQQQPRKEVTTQEKVNGSEPEALTKQ